MLFDNLIGFREVIPKLKGKKKFKWVRIRISNK